MNEDFEGFVMLWLDFDCTPEQREGKKTTNAWLSIEETTELRKKMWADIDFLYLIFFLGCADFFSCGMGYTTIFEREKTSI